MAAERFPRDALGDILGIACLRAKEDEQPRGLMAHDCTGPFFLQDELQLRRGPLKREVLPSTDRQFAKSNSEVLRIGLLHSKPCWRPMSSLTSPPVRLV